MKNKQFIGALLQHMEIKLIVALFIWISFFPEPIQAKFHLYTNIFLMLMFAGLFFRKRLSIFQLNDYSLWIFLSAISINVFFAQEKAIALKTYLNLAIPMFCVYYLVSKEFYSLKRFNLLAKIVSVSSFIVALLGILEFIFHYNPVYEYIIKNHFYERFIKSSVNIPSSICIPGFKSAFIKSVCSTQYHPTILAGYLLGCLPFQFFLFKTSKKILRVLSTIGLFFSIYLIIVNVSRSVFLGLITIIISYFFIQKRYYAILLFLCFLFAFIFICSYLPHPIDRYGVGEIISPDKSTFLSYRITRIIMVGNIVRDYPWVGLGLQNFRTRFCEYFPGKCEVPFEFRIADNMYLTILAETGIIGFLGFLLFVFSLLKRGWIKLRTLNQDYQERWQLLVSLSAFIGFLVSMGGYEFFYWPNQYIFFCIISGCITASLGNKKYVCEE